MTWTEWLYVCGSLMGAVSLGIDIGRWLERRS